MKKEVKLYEVLLTDDEIEEFSVSQLFGLLDVLNDLAGRMETNLEKMANKMNDYQFRKSQDELFYVYGNISNLEDQLMVKTAHIIHETSYAQICNN